MSPLCLRQGEQNARKALIVTDAAGRLLFGGATRQGATVPAPLRPATPAGGPALRPRRNRDFGRRRLPGLGAQTAGQVIPLPHRKFEKNARPWREEPFAQQRNAHFSQHTRAEHGIAHLKKWRAPIRHHDRREPLDGIVQAITGLASLRQAGAQRSTTALGRTPRESSPTGATESTMHEAARAAAFSRARSRRRTRRRSARPDLPAPVSGQRCATACDDVGADGEPCGVLCSLPWDCLNGARRTRTGTIRGAGSG